MRKLNADPVWLACGGSAQPDKVFPDQRAAEAHILKELVKRVIHQLATGYRVGGIMELTHVTPTHDGGVCIGFTYTLDTMAFGDKVQYAITKKSKLIPQMTYPVWTGSIQLPREQ